MSATALNFEAIAKAKARHNADCEFPPHTVRMHPFDVERLGWADGDTIAGLVLEADPGQEPECFTIVCDKDQRAELEDVEAVEREVVHV